MKLVFSAQEGAIEKWLEEAEQQDRRGQSKARCRMLPNLR